MTQIDKRSLQGRFARDVGLEASFTSLFSVIFTSFVPRHRKMCGAELSLLYLLSLATFLLANPLPAPLTSLQAANASASLSLSPSLLAIAATSNNNNNKTSSMRRAGDPAEPLTLEDGDWQAIFDAYGDDTDITMSIWTFMAGLNKDVQEIEEFSHEYGPYAPVPQNRHMFQISVGSQSFDYVVEGYRRRAMQLEDLILMTEFVHLFATYWAQQARLPSFHVIFKNTRLDPLDACHGTVNIFDTSTNAAGSNASEIQSAPVPANSGIMLPSETF